MQPCCQLRQCVCTCVCCHVPLKGTVHLGPLYYGGYMFSLCAIGDLTTSIPSVPRSLVNNLTGLQV